MCIPVICDDNATYVCQYDDKRGNTMTNMRENPACDACNDVHDTADLLKDTERVNSSMQEIWRKFNFRHIKTPFDPLFAV